VIPPRAVLIVFAKVPRPGEVKTRMCPPLSPVEASDLYANMLADVLETSARAARRLGIDAVLALHPALSGRELGIDVPTPFRVVPQRGPDLSARMAWAVREAAAGGASPILVRGSDSPALDEDAIAAALDALERCDVALRPDLDGGYNLVGLRRATGAIFDHPMSTDRALEDVLARARDLGLAVEVAAPGFDLDTIEDLRWLARERGRAARLCGRTLDFIDRRGLWSRAPAP
jgi:rSAM/selenodomain-associated transferase 1